MLLPRKTMRFTLASIFCAYAAEIGKISNANIILQQVKKEEDLMDVVYAIKIGG